MKRGGKQMNYDYSDKITLVSLNDSLLQNLKSNNQSKNDIVVYRVAEKLSEIYL